MAFCDARKIASGRKTVRLVYGFLALLIFLNPAQSQKAREGSRLDGLFDQLTRSETAIGAASVRELVKKQLKLSGSDSIDLILMRAEEAVDKKDYPFAFEMLDAVVELAPNFAHGWYMRARLGVLSGNHARTRDDLATALELELRHFPARLLMASLLTRDGKSEAARTEWLEVLEIDPHNEEARRALKLPVNAR
jgi:tetratricopeptide (TPR) repeat protein